MGQQGLDAMSEEEVVEKKSPLRLVFIHIPKCGGMSAIEGLTTAYFPLRRRATDRLLWGNRGAAISLHPAASLATGQAYGMDVLEFRRALLFYHMSNPRYNFIFGHYPFDATIGNAFCEHWHFITILRDPIERFFSAYWYNRCKKSEHARVNEDLEAYLDTPGARRGASTLTDYLVVRQDRNRSPTCAEVEQAIENLHQFTVVGFLDQMNFFADDLKARLGKRPRFRRSNENPAPIKERLQQIDTGLRRRVEEMCTADVVVYERSREMFTGRY